MDIDSHIHLRSFHNTSAIPIVKAIIVAFLIHAILLIYWQNEQTTTVAALPDWINIKLTAGFENEDNRTTSNAVNKHNPNINKVKKNTVSNVIEKKLLDIKSKQDTLQTKKLKSIETSNEKSAPSASGPRLFAESQTSL